MILYEQITRVHLELSTYCNASCPFCPRNYGGMDLNTGYPITQLSLSDIQTIFDTDFLQQVKHFLINGNLGDFMFAKDSLKILTYIRSHSPHATIEIHTNGSAQTKKFWRDLAKIDVKVYFALDGLDSTHSLYRRGTNFETVLTNAGEFIKSGGHAVWKMIKFEHNKEQLADCKSLSESLGFQEFEVITDSNRTNGHVYDKQGTYLYTLGQATPKTVPIDISLLYNRNSYNNRLHYTQEIKNIHCQAQKERSIYIAANGDVFPCCFLGFFPQSMRPEFIYGIEQVKDIMHDKKVNALSHPLRECLTWFDSIQKTWMGQSFTDGRLYICNDTCGL